MRIQQLLIFLKSVLFQPAALVHFGHHTAHLRHIIRAWRALDEITRSKHRIIEAFLSDRFAYVLKQLRVGVGQNLYIKTRLDIAPANALVVFQTVLRVLILLSSLPPKHPLAIVRFSRRLPGVVRLTTQAQHQHTNDTDNTPCHGEDRTEPPEERQAGALHTLFTIGG